MILSILWPIFLQRSGTSIFQNKIKYLFSNLNYVKSAVSLVKSLPSQLENQVLKLLESLREPDSESTNNESLDYLINTASIIMTKATEWS